ncbi:Uncharacterised protein [Chlamydia trachomatis]|nr:Uncharacterised protein [Chlamydia trachomatis]
MGIWVYLGSNNPNNTGMSSSSIWSSFWKENSVLFSPKVCSCHDKRLSSKKAFRSLTARLLTTQAVAGSLARASRSLFKKTRFSPWAIQLGKLACLCAAFSRAFLIAT